MLCMRVGATVVLSSQQRAVSEYVPVYRSGPYAILIALYREEKVCVCVGCILLSPLPHDYVYNSVWLRYDL